MSTQIDMDAERERMAAIGRAVVEYLMPGDERAARQATPALVVDRLRWKDGERQWLENSKALRVGRLVVGAYSALTSQETT